MMASPTYSGSRIFLPLSEASGIPLDQFNFVVAQLSALLLGFAMRLLLPHSLGKPTWRNIYCLLAGLYLLWFMIGWYMWLVIIQPIVCYFLLKHFPESYMQLAVFFFALGYMLFLYVLRLQENFEELCYDATYPLMITTQKLTTLAFSISDWNRFHKKGKEMTEERQKWAVREVPGLLEYFAFSLSFQGILAGPFCHYNMFRAFIEGNTKQRLQESKYADIYLDDLGSCIRAVVTKLIAVIFWVIITAWVKPHFPDSRNVDEDFIEQHNMLTRIGYLYISFLFHRAKYYVTWILADAVYNSSGMGYAGKDERGRHQWTAMSNVFVLKIETATSPKVYMDNWNILTTHWLRYVVYTRAPFLNTLLTFMLSAVWHGLFIGYYVTFVSAAFAVQAARKLRANVRPLFQSSRTSRIVYDFMTFLATQLGIAFLVLSFVILRWEPTIRFHSSFYWACHIAIIFVLLVFPAKKKSLSSEQQQQQENDTTNHLEANNHIKEQFQDNHHNGDKFIGNHHKKGQADEHNHRNVQQMIGKGGFLVDGVYEGDERLRKREVMFVQKS